MMNILVNGKFTQKKYIKIKTKIMNATFGNNKVEMVGGLLQVNGKVYLRDDFTFIEYQALLCYINIMKKIYYCNE